MIVVHNILDLIVIVQVEKALGALTEATKTGEGNLLDLAVKVGDVILLYHFKRRMSI